jgi:hypothetical protein
MLHITHLLLLGLWGGVVAAETVIEFAPGSDGELRFSAKLHYWIDLVIELPLLVGILVSGAMLSSAAWPLRPMLVAKIVCALGAIAINLWCAALVVRRHRQGDDVAALVHTSRRIRLAWVGVPLAGAALLIGLMGW